MNYACNKCKETKPVSEFYKRKPKGFYSPCKLCQQIKAKYNWRNNKIVILKRHKEIRIKNKLRAIEYLGNTCSKCKCMFHHVVYDFHHPDNNKEVDIGSILLKTWENIKKELDKCVLLCANCHRIEHYGEVLS